MNYIRIVTRFYTMQLHVEEERKKNGKPRLSLSLS